MKCVKKGIVPFLTLFKDNYAILTAYYYVTLVAVCIDEKVAFWYF